MALKFRVELVWEGEKETASSIYLTGDGRVIIARTSHGACEVWARREPTEAMTWTHGNSIKKRCRFYGRYSRKNTPMSWEPYSIWQRCSGIPATPPEPTRSSCTGGGSTRPS